MTKPNDNYSSKKTVAKKNVRVSARLDTKDNRLVKGVQLEGLRPLGDVEAYAKYYANNGIDEIVFIDIVASLYGRSQMYDMISLVAKQNFIPITVVGGIRTLSDIAYALKHGADKVAINTQAQLKPEFLNEAVREFGSSTIVLSVEAKKNSTGDWSAYFNSGRDTLNRKLIGWATEAQDRGVGEILVTDVNRDGTKRGFDLDMLKVVEKVCQVPIVASGGAQSPDDCVRAASIVNGIAIGSILHNGAPIEHIDVCNAEGFSVHRPQRLRRKGRAHSIQEIKQALHSSGYDVRREIGQ